MHRRRPAGADRHGFTLLEVTIASALLISLIGAALSVLMTTNDHVGQGLARVDLASRANHAVQLVTNQLRDAAVSTVTLAAGTPAPTSGHFTSISYSRVIGFDTSQREVLLGPPLELRFELAAGESWNSPEPLDDDGDGLIDEGDLVLYQAGRRVGVLASDLNGSSVSYSFASGAATGSDTERELSVSFTLQRRVLPGKVEEHQKAFLVAIRN